MCRQLDQGIDIDPS